MSCCRNRDTGNWALQVVHGVLQVGNMDYSQAEDKDSGELSGFFLPFTPALLFGGTIRRGSTTHAATTINATAPSIPTSRADHRLLQP